MFSFLALQFSTLFLGLFATAAVVWIGLRKLGDPDSDAGSLVLRLIMTVGLTLYMITTFVAAYSGRGSLIFAFAVVLLTGLAYALMWARSVGELVGGFFGDLYGMGSEGKEVPLYSMAVANRKQGHYEKALDLIEEQLARFPDDFDGLMLKAEILAQDERNLAGASATVLNLVLDNPHKDQVSVALNRLADWKLKIGEDPLGAKDSLQMIVARFPESSFARQAQQRMEHLPSAEELERRREAQPMAIEGTGGKLKQVSRTAAELVDHLARHPHDVEARVELAIAYVREHQHLELAEQELKSLIDDEAHPAKARIAWLNLLADLQIEATGASDKAVLTLHRILDGFAGTSGAELAEKRLHLLNRQVAGQKEGQAVKLGSYEKKLGLKGRYRPQSH